MMLISIMKNYYIIEGDDIMIDDYVTEDHYEKILCGC